MADLTPRLPESEAPQPEAVQSSTGETRTDEGNPATARQLLRYPAWSAPVLSEGILYLRGKGRLAAFALR